MNMASDLVDYFKRDPVLNLALGPRKLTPEQQLDLMDYYDQVIGLDATSLEVLKRTKPE